MVDKGSQGSFAANKKLALGFLFRILVFLDSCLSTATS